MMQSLMILIISGISLSACSSFGTDPSYSPEKKSEAITEPSPSPTPPKKPEELYRCKISNGAGRTFTVSDESRDRSEAKARHQCEIFSRTCILLDCVKVEEDGE